MRRRSFIAGVAVATAMSGLQKATGAELSIPERFAATLNAHDIEAFAALFSDSYVNHQASAAAPAPKAGVTPKMATVAFFAARLKGLPDLNVSIQVSLAQADKVAASFAYEGTHNGIYLGIPPTGKRITFTSCDIFRVAEGKIVEHWGMGDIAGVVAQLKG